MRVMISQPMKGLTVKQIEQNRDAAVKRLEAEGHVVEYAPLNGGPPMNDRDALWSLGDMLQRMSYCDAVLFLDGWQEARGCKIERAACEAYGLKVMEG